MSKKTYLMQTRKTLRTIFFQM